MGCVCEKHAAFRDETARGAEEEESRGGSREGGGELRLRSTRGKAFGCCSKFSSPQWAGKERESVVGVMVVLVGEKETDW